MAALKKRPSPPKDMPAFLPAPEVFEWVQRALFDSSSKLYNADHEHLHHLEMPSLSFLWANGGFKKQGKFVLGQCEKVMFRAGGWQKERQEMQMHDWFGDVPTFLITLDARFCSTCSDVEFCALVEHELYHIAQAKDDFGCPAFNLQTGEPKLMIQSHDVEEFFGVVRRYGASQSNIQKLIDIGKKRPEIGLADIAHACGTCLLKLA